MDRLLCTWMHQCVKFKEKFWFSSSFNMCTVLLKFLLKFDKVLLKFLLFHNTNRSIIGIVICIISLLSCLSLTPILTSLKYVFVYLNFSHQTWIILLFENNVKVTQNHRIRVSWDGRDRKDHPCPIPGPAQDSLRNHTLCQRALSKHFFNSGRNPGELKLKTCLHWFYTFLYYGKPNFQAICPLHSLFLKHISFLLLQNGLLFFQFIYWSILKIFFWTPLISRR